MLPPLQWQDQAECLAQVSEEEMQLGDVSGAPNTGDEKGKSAH